MRGGLLEACGSRLGRKKESQETSWDTSIEVKSGPSSQNGSGCSLLKSEHGLDGGVRRAGMLDD